MLRHNDLDVMVKNENLDEVTFRQLENAEQPEVGIVGHGYRRLPAQQQHLEEVLYNRKQFCQMYEKYL